MKRPSKLVPLSVYISKEERVKLGKNAKFWKMTLSNYARMRLGCEGRSKGRPRNGRRPTPRKKK